MPILLRHEETIRLKIGGPVVGLLPAATYQQGSIELQRGDLVMLFTLRISESMNAATRRGEKRRWSRLRRVVVTDRQSRFETLLIASAEAFAGGTPQHNDMTVVVLLAIQTSNPHRVSRLGERIGRPSASACAGFLSPNGYHSRCAVSARINNRSSSVRVSRTPHLAHRSDDGPAARLTAWSWERHSSSSSTQVGLTSMTSACSDSHDVTVSCTCMVRRRLIRVSACERQIRQVRDFADTLLELLMR